MSDDWFERVLGGAPDDDADAADDDAAGTDTDADATTANGETRSPESTADAGDEGDPDEWGGDGFDGEIDPDEFGDEFAPEGADDGVAGESDDAFDGGFGDGGVAGESDGADDPFADGSLDDEDPFGRDFASAMDSAPSPGGLGGGDGPDQEGGFGGLGGFDDGGDFGFGGGAGGGAGGGFDADATFDSDIDRIEIGIEGLDEMILGGVPERSLMAAIGGAGTGKTTFGLQFLHHGLRQGDRGVYITLEESRERILETADEKGWAFTDHVEAGDLAVIDLDPVEMANSLASISNDLPRLIDDFDAGRLVLDSVSLLEMMYDHPAKRRSEVFDFARSLKEVGVTIMVTSEASADSAYASRHGLIEYLADAVFVLQYVRPSDFRETRLAVEIQKIRDANHSRETKPYEITDDGLSVYRQANIF